MTPVISHADVTNNLWKVGNSIVQPVLNSWNVGIPFLATTTNNNFVTVNASGTLLLSGVGNIPATTTINGFQSLSFLLSGDGTTITSTVTGATTTFSLITPVSNINGGTGTSSFGWTGFPYVTAGVWAPTSTPIFTSSSLPTDIAYLDKLQTFTLPNTFNVTTTFTTTTAASSTITTLNGTTANFTTLNAIGNANITGRVLTGNGSASLPGHSFTSMTNAGLHASPGVFPTIALTVSSSDLMVFGYPNSTTVAQVIVNTSGNATDPALNIGANNGNGIYSPSINTLAFGTLGALAIGINSSQNVGIGTTTPASKLTDIGTFTVTQTSTMATTTITSSTITTANIGTLNIGTTNGSILFTTSSGQVSQDNSNFYWDNVNHRLGIGTTTPSEAEQVYNGTVLINQPTTPLSVATLTTGNGINAIAPFGGKYAVAVGASGIVNILDFSTFGSPKVLSTTTLGATTFNAVVMRGNTAFITGSNGSMVWALDVSNRYSPMTLGSVNVGGGVTVPNGLAQKDGVLYMADSTNNLLKIINIANPTFMSLITTTTLPSADSIIVDNNNAYAGTSNGKFISFDITTSTAPTIIGSTTISGQLYGMAQAGTNVYIANGTGLENVVSVSTPSTPIAISTTTILNAHFQSIKVAGNLAYLNDYGNHTLDIINNTSTTAPTVVSQSFQLPLSNNQDLAIYGRYLVSVDNGGRATVVDVKGLDVATANIGNLNGNDIFLTNNLDVGQNANIHGSLAADAGISSDGPLVVNSLTVTSTLNGSIALNGTITGALWNGQLISPAYGGLGIDSSASTGWAYDNGGAWSISSTPIFTSSSLPSDLMYNDKNQTVTGNNTFSASTTFSTTTNFGGQILAADGASFAPSMSFVNASSTGCWHTTSAGKDIMYCGVTNGVTLGQGFINSTTTRQVAILQNGTDALPGLFFQDQGNGISRPAANVMAFSNNGIRTFQTDASNNMGIGTTTPNSRLQVNGTFALTSSSTVLTPTISGAIVTSGCDSATSSVDTSYTSSTVAFVDTPQVFMGNGVFPPYSVLTASGVITTYVCADFTVTPTASKIVVKIIK